MKIVVTGSTKGIGKALAAKYLALGDEVIVTSRKQANVDAAVKEFQERYPKKVWGCVCDVQDPKSIDNLVEFAVTKLGKIDHWVNNAGTSGSNRDYLVDMDPEEIKRIIGTNVTGLLLCCRAVLKQMLKQSHGHIFNMEGMGSRSWRTAPGSLCYATSKRAIPMVQKTLLLELKDIDIGIHDISPGMVLTDLIMKDGNIEPRLAKILNILAEKADTVADYLVPRMRSVKKTGQRIDFLTIFGSMKRFMTAAKRKNRFFDEEGNLLVEL
jgi:chlorophyll(ide) b reductase